MHVAVRVANVAENGASNRFALSRGASLRPWAEGLQIGKVMHRPVMKHPCKHKLTVALHVPHNWKEKDGACPLFIARYQQCGHMTQYNIHTMVQPLTENSFLWHQRPMQSTSVLYCK